LPKSVTTNNESNDFPDQCPVCASLKKQFKYAVIQNLQYYECSDCISLYANFPALKLVKPENFEYDAAYWKDEISAAKQRSFGSSLARSAEVFFYSRIPINRFLDIGSGPGFLLDALSTLMPNHASMFYGIELFPPPEPFRSKHPNFVIGDVGNLRGKFDGGVCIEVIEHLHPEQLHQLVSRLSKIASANAVFLFNSAQPSFVKQTDPNYLDPYGRGHIVSYSIAALRPIFSKYGFNVIPLPGRDWAFLAEYNSPQTFSTDDMIRRLWTALSQNTTKLKENGFGELMYTLGLESARYYLESAVSSERTNWVISLQNMIRKVVK
jgi:hypothetical protein